MPDLLKIVGILCILFLLAVSTGAIFINGYLVHQQDKLRAELYMAEGEREAQGRELDKCRVQRRDLREGK